MSIVLEKDLLTGNELIDSEHKELIDRINKLVDSCESGKEKTTAVRILDFLMDYTDFHFRDEEKLQEESGYPEIENHKLQHKVFEKAVNELKEMLEEEEGPTEAFVAAVNKNITEWFLNHIQVWDKKVAEHVKG